MVIRCCKSPHGPCWTASRLPQKAWLVGLHLKGILWGRPTRIASARRNGAPSSRHNHTRVRLRGRPAKLSQVTCHGPKGGCALYEDGVGCQLNCHHVQQKLAECAVTATACLTQCYSVALVALTCAGQIKSAVLVVVNTRHVWASGYVLWSCMWKLHAGVRVFGTC
jgi:hypothetical protein